MREVAGKEKSRDRISSHDSASSSPIEPEIETRRDVTTSKVANAFEIAQHYLPGAPRSGDYYRVPCPAHGGTGNNLSVGDGDDGGLILKCFSTECSYKEIVAAFARDGLTLYRTWTYCNGKTVNRKDTPNGNKDFRSEGTTKGVPLLLRGGNAESLVVVVEGEADADAILASGANVTAACYVGGAGMAGSADYDAVKGRDVAVWPDNDEQGIKAANAAAQASAEAGAASVSWINPPGKSGSGFGAADDPPVMIKMRIGAKQPWESPIEGAPVPTSITSIMAAPDPEWMVRGMVPKAGMSLMIGIPKAGKSLVMLALVRALTTGQSLFGTDFDQREPVWIFSELSERVFKAQLRIMRYKPDPQMVEIFLKRHQPTYENGLARAEATYNHFLRSRHRPGLIVTDTLGKFYDFDDLNDYSRVTSSMAPLIDVSQRLADDHGVTMLLLHHARKGGGTGSERVLGSSRLAGDVDSIITVQKRSSGENRRVQVESRFGADEPGPDFDITLDMASGQYILADSTGEVEAEIMALIKSGVEKKADIKVKLNEGDDGGYRIEDDKLYRRLDSLIKQGRVRREGKTSATVYKLAK